MKTARLLIVCTVFSMVFFACEKNEAKEIITQKGPSVVPFSVTEMTKVVNHFSMKFFATAYE